jgi:hypothetical protein
MNVLVHDGPDQPGGSVSSGFFCATLASRCAAGYNRSALDEDTPVITRLDLIHELHADAPADQRCPHLEHDTDGCRCRRVVADLAGELPADEANQAGQMVCDHFSLQLWCLAGPERWAACAFYAPADSPCVPSADRVQLRG